MLTTRFQRSATVAPSATVTGDFGGSQIGLAVDDVGLAVCRCAGIHSIRDPQVSNTLDELFGRDGCGLALGRRAEQGANPFGILADVVRSPRSSCRGVIQQHMCRQQLIGEPSCADAFNGAPAPPVVCAIELPAAPRAWNTDA